MDVGTDELECIFASLHARALCMCLCTCKRWREVAASDSLWQAIVKTEFDISHKPMHHTTYKALFDAVRVSDAMRPHDTMRSFDDDAAG